MGRLVVSGTVPNFNGSCFNLPADNGAELVTFYRTEGINTKLDYVAGKPVVTVSAERFVKQCRSGYRVRYSIESVNRSGRRGIRGVDLQVESDT